MGFQFSCQKCHTPNYIEKTKKKYDKYACSDCGYEYNWLYSDSELEEISLEEFNKNNKKNKKREKEVESSQQTLSQKYSILELYKGLAFLLMIASTGFFIYSLVEYFDAPKVAREMLENAMITSTISYIITMFSLFCLTKMIDFLFDLDLKSNK